MKKIVLASMIVFWTFYVAIVSIGVYDNFFGKKDVSQNATKDLGNTTDIVLNELEISKHNKVSDCWSIISGKVYNLTSYLDKHPARADTILPYCGVAGDKGYSTKDKIIAQVHSAFADKLLVSYLLGYLGQTIKAGGQNVLASMESPNISTASAPKPTSTNATSLGADQVAKHNTAADCWFIINSKVYNITTYFGKHPGGDRGMLNYCGADASSAFNGLPHSTYAIGLLGSYRIGSLGETVTITSPPVPQGSSGATAPSQESESEDEEEENDD